MELRKLGDRQVCALGIGAWAIGGEVTRDGVDIGWTGTDEATSLRAMQMAFDGGVNVVDTSDAYGAGRSERLIGEAIKGRRDDIIIATKFGHIFDEQARTMGEDRWDADYIRTACEGSLQRLGVDCIDLYQCHIGWATDDGEMMREVLEELVQVGKIRWFGWSTDRVSSFEKFADSPHCVAVQQHCNVSWDEWSNIDLLRLAEGSGCASLARTPLGRGLFADRFRDGNKAGEGFPANDIRSHMNLSEGPKAETLARIDAVREILQSDGRSTAQGALAWVWAMSPNAIPIPSFRHEEHVAGLLGALDYGPLTPDQMREIDCVLDRTLYEAPAGTEVYPGQIIK